MDMNVPILNPEQIEDLNLMVHNLLQQNTKTIDQVLSQIVDVQSTSIMKLYNLVVEEVAKKQKIIDNLCHFSLTMMSTVQFLWGQKNDHQEKLSNAEVVIGSLNKHIQQLGEQYEIIKHKIQQAQTHIESISGQKQKIEELYRSQSCCSFVGNGYFSDIHTSTQKSEAHPRFSSEAQQKPNFLEQYSRTLQEKQNEISVLRDEKKELQQRISQLMQEHQLVKMQVQLAEIAVKDALSYRESSMLNSSKSDMNNSYRDEIYTTKSHAQFLNGDLQCFSNLEESFNLDRRHINIKELVATEDNFRDSSLIQNQSLNGNSFGKRHREDKQVQESPFKRKQSKNYQLEHKCMTEYYQPQEGSRKAKGRLQSFIAKNTKTVSLQCDLLTNAPKIEFLQKQITKKRQEKSKNAPLLEDNKDKRLGKNMKNAVNKQQGKKPPLSQSQIVRRPNQSNRINRVEDPQNKKTQQKYSLGTILNFFTTKIVSQRIKVK